MSNELKLDIAKILIKDSLYTVYDLSEISKHEILNLQYFQGTVDSFCIDCNKDSVFKSQVELPKIYISGTALRPKTFDDVILDTDDKDAFSDKKFAVVIGCTRNQEHRIIFHFLIKNKNLIKIGQYPSIADFELTRLKKYDKILTKTQRKEFGRAIGLYSHGIGIGAFVYLRRIFKNLVELAYRDARRLLTINEDEFLKCKMDRKIKILKDYLPELLVENANIYSILSKGIHSLSEQECLKYFNTIKLGIELILEEKIKKREEEVQKKTLSREISKIKGELS